MNPSVAIESDFPAIAAEPGPRLHGRVLARSRLSRGTEDAMFSLLSSHFTGVDRATFQRDLAEKDVVIAIEDERHVLRGFSTMLVYQTTAPGRRLTIVYSGDTIVERGCWRSPALARTWIRLVRQVAPVETGEVHWLLLTSGYRTYRFLPVFFQSFYPRYDENTPAAVQAMVDAIASERFGARYDAAAGLVRFEHPQNLADDLVTVPAGRTADPHIDFFLARNPGFATGDELVCLTPIHDANLTRAGRRMAGLTRT